MTAAMHTVGPKKKARSNRRHIPMEMVEEILLHLPVKSVLRFSSVSKSWRSMISEQRFIQRYGSAAAVSGRERILISPFIGNSERRIVIFPSSSIPYSSYSLSSISPSQDEIKIVRPFMETPYIVASCEELWCVEVGESLFLWNPSINSYKKLADSSPPLYTGIRIAIEHYYGLGYDCVDDDYKILKFSAHDNVVQTTELYSLRKDSWRNIELFHGDIMEDPCLCVFVSGALHWVDYSRDIIVYFDLTTEMYGEVVPAMASSDDSCIGVIALRRKLCTYLNNYRINKFVLWVMEDYGVDKPWSKLYEIQATNGVPSAADYYFETLTPLYLYDNGDVLIKIMLCDGNWSIFIYKKGDPIPKEIVARIESGYVYVESLVSPAAAAAMRRVHKND